MTPRVLVVARAYGEHSGGMERLSFEFVAALRQTTADVDIIAHRGSRHTSPLFALWCIPRVLLSARRANIVHLGDPMLSLAGWLVKKIYGIPIVVTVHGLDISYRSALYQWYLRLFFNSFDHYIAISRHVAGLLRDRGINAITVINPGITDRHFDPAASRQSLEHLLGRDLRHALVLTTIGRVVERKGQAWFVRNVLPKLPNHFIYVVAGTGPGMGALRQAIDETGLNDRVIILGNVPEATVKTLYNTVDAFVQPNIVVPGDVEGFGLVLLEAALCQRPVFAAELEGIIDAVAEPAIGRLLPSGDPVAWIAAIRGTAASPQAAGARDAVLTHFNWPKIIQQYLALYATLTLKRPKPS